MKTQFTLRDLQILLINGLFVLATITACLWAVSQCRDLADLITSSAQEALTQTTYLIFSGNR